MKLEIDLVSMLLVKYRWTSCSACWKDKKYKEGSLAWC